MANPQGNPISLGKAAKKYGISKMTLSTWAKQGRITVLQYPEARGQSLMVDEASVIVAREAYTPYWRKNEPRQIGMAIGANPPHPPPHPSAPPSMKTSAHVAASPSGELNTGDLIRAYLAQGANRGWSEATKTSYTRVLTQFGEACPDLPLTPEPVQSFIASLDIVQFSKHHYYVIIKAFYSWLTQRHGIASPLTRFTVPSKGKPTLRRTFAPDEIEALIEAIPDRETKTIVLLLRATAIRVGELCNLRREDIFKDHIKIQALSGSKTGARDVPIPPWIHNLLKVLGNGSVLFPGRGGKPMSPDAVSSRLKHFMLEAGLKGKKLGPHALRHTAATELLEDTGDLEFVRQILGHTNIGTTSIYASLTQSKVQKKYQEQSRMVEPPPEAQALL